MASSVQNSRVSPAGYCAPCRTCNMWCWRVFKWLPVVLIVSIVSWSYFAYVIQLCIFTIESAVQQWVYLLAYHFLLIMFLWSYWRTIFAAIEPIPDKYKLPQAELEKLLSADTEDAQRSILENFAKDLPIVTSILILTRKLTRMCFRKDNKETKKAILLNFGENIPVLTRTMSGSVRYCNRCVLVKPDRAHHCSICSRCVMKMDHHCPWVNNCVCFHNYKFFMLFLGYALVYCLFIAGSTLPYFIKFWKMYQQYKKADCDELIKSGTFSRLCLDMINWLINFCNSTFDGPHPFVLLLHQIRRSIRGGELGMDATTGRYHIVFAFFVSLMFAISLGSLFGYHCFLVSRNRTTLEAFRAPMFRGGADKNGFSLGCYNNFKEVFGISPNLWFVPVSTSLGDGCEFPVRREHQLQTFTTPAEQHGYDSMGTTRSSFGDGIVYPVPRQDEESESLLSSERWDQEGRWGETRARLFDERGSSSFDEL